MDPHLLAAFLDGLTDAIADKVVKRLRQSQPEPERHVESATPDESAASEFLTTSEAAALLRLSPKSLEGMRSKGRGPKYIKVGGAVRYRRGDLDQGG
jgi:hypothetical protein